MKMILVTRSPEDCNESRTTKRPFEEPEAKSWPKVKLFLKFDMINACLSRAHFCENNFDMHSYVFTHCKQHFNNVMDNVICRHKRHFSIHHVC